jgi:hypothetical protein
MRLIGRPGLTCILLVLALLAFPSSGSGAPAKVRHGTFEAAEATWFVKRHGDIYMYFVLAYRIEKPVGSARTRLFADKSKCRVKRARGKRMVTCMLEGRVEKLRPADFRVQPLLSGAILDYGDHRISWDGAQTPEPDVAPYVDPDAAFADAYLERLSGAGGRLFDRRMPSKGLDHAALSLGVDVAVITSLEDFPPRLRLTTEVEWPSPSG